MELPCFLLFLPFFCFFPAVVVGRVSTQKPMVLPPDVAFTRATAAIAALQGFYNSTTGLWDNTGWWGSANCLTVFAEYAAYNTSFANEASVVFETTLTNAQNYEVPSSSVFSAARYMKMASHNGNDTIVGLPAEHSNIDVVSRYTVSNFPGFLNDFYDDEGWWALGWIQAYDATNQTQTKYLGMAEAIFKDMTLGWSDGTGNVTKCQGLWWNKQQTHINAIENELFLSVAAHLANRVPSDQKQYYIDWALKEWNWFQGTGMIRSNFGINDGIDLTTCQNNGEPVWTYNQGVILGGLVELNKAAPKEGYLTLANNIASAAINRFANSAGIIEESCDPECQGDGEQFKGIFIRNLYILWQETQQPQFLTTIQKNAESIWNFDRGTDNRFGSAWTGPYRNASGRSHSSASDAIVAAAMVNNQPASGSINIPNIPPVENNGPSIIATVLPSRAPDQPY